MSNSPAPTPLPPYALEVDVELAVVLAECSEPRFHTAIGRALDPERMRDPAARMLVAAAHAVAKKMGRPPTWPSIPVQHLATLMNAGKVTHDQLMACKDYVIEAMSLPPVFVDDLIGIVTPIIQRVMYKDAIVEALDGFKNNADPGDTARTFDQVSKLGKSNVVVAATVATIAAAPDFFDQKPADMLALGVPDLDQALEGGLERGALGLLVGGSGAGKSMALTHAAVEATVRGHDGLYVTLELSPSRVTQRIVRNMIDMTKRECREFVSEARRRMTLMNARAGVGTLVVVSAEPGITSPRDIRVLIEQAKRENPGFQPKAFFVDFLDKVRVNQKASLYEDMLAVTDGLRDIASDEGGWMWTASQSDRKSTGKPWLDLDAIADSMNKIRSADLVVAIGRTEEDQMADLIRFSVPKRREGEGAYTRVGPIACDFDRGRIVVVSDRTYPW